MYNSAAYYTDCKWNVLLLSRRENNLQIVLRNPPISVYGSWFCSLNQVKDESELQASRDFGLQWLG